jgi:hypothetical protein
MLQSFNVHAAAWFAFFPLSLLGVNYLLKFYFDKRGIHWFELTWLVFFIIATAICWGFM